MNVQNNNDGWKEVADVLKQRYAELTDDDLFVFDGREEEMLERIRCKLGKTREEVRIMIVYIYLRNKLK